MFPCLSNYRVDQRDSHINQALTLLRAAGEAHILEVEQSSQTHIDTINQAVKYPELRCLFFFDGQRIPLIFTKIINVEKNKRIDNSDSYLSNLIDKEKILKKQPQCFLLMAICCLYKNTLRSKNSSIWTLITNSLICKALLSLSIRLGLKNYTTILKQILLGIHTKIRFMDFQFLKPQRETLFLKLKLQLERFYQLFYRQTLFIPYDKIKSNHPQFLNALLVY